MINSNKNKTRCFEVGDPPFCTKLLEFNCFEQKIPVHKTINMITKETLLLLFYLTSLLLEAISSNSLLPTTMPRAYFKFQTDTRNFKDSTLFPSLVPLSGTISLSLCDMLKTCLHSSHSSKLTFSLSLTPNNFNCLQPALSKSVCVSVCACACVLIGRGWGGVGVEGCV